MNQLIALCLLAAVVPLLAEPANRAKRFAAFGSLSTVGGRVGCVVSHNKLFINGHFTKDLSEDEQEELKQYQDQLTQFKEDVKAYLEERQKQFRAQVGAGPAQPKGAEPAEAQPKGQQLKKPEPPKKPSFCSDKATTQYVFDGCSVQGDNVFIGDTFVRKLSPAELKELEEFDRKFTTYQKAVTAGFRKQVEEMFGSHFGSLFGAGDASGGSSAASGSAESGNAAAGNKTPSAGAEVQPREPAPEAPKTPNFCTLIV